MMRDWRLRPLAFIGALLWGAAGLAACGLSGSKPVGQSADAGVTGGGSSEGAAVDLTTGGEPMGSGGDAVATGGDSMTLGTPVTGGMDASEETPVTGGMDASGGMLASGGTAATGGLASMDDEDAGTPGAAGVEPLLCDEAFEPCGGDPTGVWKLVSGCAQMTVPFAPDCPGAEAFTSVFDVEGVFEVSETSIWQTFNGTIVAHARIPASCYVGRTCADAFTDPSGTWEIVGENDSECRMEQVNTHMLDVMGPISIDGNRIVGPVTEQHIVFCRDGEQMRWGELNDIQGLTYTLEKM